MNEVISMPDNVRSFPMPSHSALRVPVRYTIRDLVASGFSHAEAAAIVHAYGFQMKTRWYITQERFDRGWAKLTERKDTPP